MREEVAAFGINFRAPRLCLDAFFDYFTTFRCFLSVGQRKPPCAGDLLLPDSDPCVEVELQSRLSRPIKKHKYDVKKYQQMFVSEGLCFFHRFFHLCLIGRMLFSSYLKLSF